ncbi:MAG: H-type lectin domain-containing protein [Paracoccaceae bacterium]
MKRLQNHYIGVDQGDIVLFSDYDTDGEMWAGDGHRRREARVVFSQSYRAPPSVQASISMWDVGHGANLRADLTVHHIDREGCTLRLCTWGDTRIARLRASWMAIGEVPHADEWDLY